jgi:UV-endonuclease UvdE
LVVFNFWGGGEDTWTADSEGIVGGPFLSLTASDSFGGTVGAYGDKSKALGDFALNLDRLSSRVRSRLTVENDDKTYTPADLLPICKDKRLSRREKESLVLAASLTKRRLVQAVAAK